MLDTIMKELINEYKGVKEAMHTIIEEDEECYNDTILGFPLNISQDGLDESKQSEDMNSRDLSNSEFLSSLNNSQMGESSEQKLSPKIPSQSYSETGFRDGRILFNYMKTDVGKSLPIKSATKVDTYLDRVTFIGRKLVSIWFGRDIPIEHFSLFIDLLKDKNYLVSFPLMMESF